AGEGEAAEGTAGARGPLFRRTSVGMKKTLTLATAQVDYLCTLRWGGSPSEFPPCRTMSRLPLPAGELYSIKAPSDGVNGVMHSQRQLLLSTFSASLLLFMVSSVNGQIDKGVEREGVEREMAKLVALQELHKDCPIPDVKEFGSKEEIEAYRKRAI